MKTYKYRNMAFDKLDKSFFTYKYCCWMDLRKSRYKHIIRTTKEFTSSEQLCLMIQSALTLNLNLFIYYFNECLLFIKFTFF